MRALGRIYTCTTISKYAQNPYKMGKIQSVHIHLTTATTRLHAPLQTDITIIQFSVIPYVLGSQMF